MMNSGRCLAAAGLAALLAGWAIACGNSTPTTPTPPPPPVVKNTPPTIQSITPSASRAEAGKTLQFTAVVQDAETPISQLTYQWSATPANGTFVSPTATPNGQQVTWQVPSAETTPDTYTVTLTVIESYTSGGQQQQNKVSSSVTVHYNNSSVEVVHLATDFLVNKFGNYSVSPQECVVNFSDSCSGKRDELSDITYERAHYHILSSTFTATSVSFDSGMTNSTVQGPCVFEDIPGPGMPNAGIKERVSGICYMTEVFDGTRWWLCVSHFLNGTSTPEDLLRRRVPGQIVGSSYSASRQ